MKIKICGITRVEDAQFAVDAGVWGVGFIFVKNTPRYLAPEKARDIINNLPENVEKIGVFADSPLSEILNTSKQAGLTKIQLHGSEPPEYCSNISQISRKEIIKAIRVKNTADIEIISQYKNCVSYILLDTFSENQRGGTGQSFDWDIAIKAKQYNIPIILAGGLNPDNLAEAHKKVKPFAMDLSSGAEASKGIKDPEKIKMLKNIIKFRKAEP